MKKKVAFVCVHNSCRSQMAEGWAKKLGSDVLEAYSAGTEKYPEVKPLAVQVMEEAGVDMSDHHPKLLSDIPAEVDILITMGCGSSVYLEDYTSESEKKVNMPKEDKIKALDVITKYFYAFSQNDFDKMRSLSTDRHNEEYMHDGDVWGIKWALVKEIKMVGDVEFLKSESLKPVIVFDVLAYVERVGKSDVFPSAQLSFYVSVEKGEDGVWRVDRYFKK